MTDRGLHTVETPDPGEAQLQEILQGLKTKIVQHLTGFSSSLEETLTTPLQSAFENAREVHQRLMDEAGILPGGSRTTPDVPLDWRKVRIYQEGVRKEVMEPLRETLGDLEVGKNVALRWEGFRNGLPKLMEDLPEILVRQEPRDLYEPRTGDGIWTSVRKAGVRAGRRIRSVAATAGRGLSRAMGRTASPPPPPQQSVPLQRLVRESLLIHCPLSLEPFTEALQQRYAVPLADLSSRFTRWAREWYPAVESCHAPSHHLSPETMERLQSSLASIQPPEPLEEEAEAGTGEVEPATESREAESPDPRAVARALHEILEEGSTLPGPTRALARIGETMEEEWTHLLHAVRVAGSFQATSDQRAAGNRIKRMDDRIRGRGTLWTEWHSANLQRLTLVFSLMRIREGWDRAQDQLLEPIARDLILPVVEPWMEARNGLLALEEETRARLSSKEEGADLQSALPVVEETLSRAETLLEERFIHPMDQAEAEEVAWAEAESAVGILSDALRAAPPLLVYGPGQEEPDRVEPNVEFRKAPLREHLLKIVDVVRLEALRTTPRHILEIFAGARSEYREVPKITTFNLASARDDLQSPSETGTSSDTLSEAANLVTEGLARTASAIQDLLAELPSAWDDFADDAHRFFAESFREIHGRALVEGFVQEQILDVRSRIASRIRNGLEALREHGKTLTATLTRFLRRIRVRGARIARFGRSAVGMSEDLEGEAARALEILRVSPGLLDSLPLGYRKLFSFQPVVDPTLLTGRLDEMDWVNRRFQAWKEGVGTPCVLMGSPGSGQTSLLNVLCQTLFQDSRITRLALDFRPQGEGELARWLWDGMEMSGNPPGTLGQIPTTLEERGGGEVRRVVIVENLEHLLLRTPGGTDLVERFLAFQARTANQLFWISTVLEPAWKYLEKAEPASVSLASTQVLAPLSRPTLEELILNRHQRSGLSLEFQEPTNMGLLLRRKLRSARGIKNRQALLRTEVFDRLHRISQGSTAMALLFWLHSLDFSSQDGKVKVRTPRSVVFAFLEDLDVSLDFALMALLEHGSLTLDEYARVFGVSIDEAWQVFEVLRARMLLEPAGNENSLPRALATVLEGTRYRVPPILARVVVQRLRNRNILH